MNKTHHVPCSRPTTPWIRNSGVGPADEGADSTSQADPETSDQIHATGYCFAVNKLTRIDS